MIRCAFHAHAQRAVICKGEATSFFKTQKGTLWPLCGPCSERHRQIVLEVIKVGGVHVDAAAAAVFDIPLDDPETLATFRLQDPKALQRVIQAVDERWLDEER